MNDNYYINLFKKKSKMNIIEKIKWQVRKFLIDHYPQIIIQHEWPGVTGHEIDWNNPRDINEKIQWLMCFSDTSEWTRLADKYLVRDFIKERGFENILTKLYGVWDNANDIDFDVLPEKFVLKCNHDSASTIIVDKRKGFDRKNIVSFLNKCLKRKFGYVNCEPHYNKIPPKIIAEEFLEEKNSSYRSLTDYKFWCFDGKAYYICVMFDRTDDNVYETVYDIEWNNYPDYLQAYDQYKRGENILPKPDNLKEMIAIAELLSKGFPEVRVDLYNVDGKIYFGEMTFSANRGRMRYEKTFLEKLGNLVQLPPKKK